MTCQNKYELPPHMHLSIIKEGSQIFAVVIFSYPIYFFPLFLALEKLWDS